MKQTLKHLALAMLIAGTIAVLRAPITHAASISVASGLDTTNVDSTCTLSEAITNINAGDATAYPECTGTGPFGSTDTVILPTGDIKLTADLPVITQSIVIEGKGMGASTVDGDGQWGMFKSENALIDSITIKKMKLTAFVGSAIFANSNGGSDDLSNLVISEVEIDGANAVEAGGSIIGMQMFVTGAGSHSMTVENSYLHDLKGSAAGTVSAIMAGSANNSLALTVSSTTVSDLENTDAGAQAISIVNGPFSSMAPGDIVANVSNFTANNIVSSTDIAAGIGVLSMVSGGHTSAIVNANAVTIKGINGAINSAFGVSSGAVFVAGLADAPSDSSVATLNLTNAVLADNKSSGAPANCSSINLNSAFSGTGAVNLTITSNGGNLTDDTTCNPYFTKTTDQNNLGTLGSTLGALSNNGGFVPTIPLLQGSPAIDAGVTISGMTQDARFATRPQGTAFDSGAYESPFTKPQATLAGTGSDTLIILLASVGLVGAGTGYLFFKFRQSRQ